MHFTSNQALGHAGYVKGNVWDFHSVFLETHGEKLVLYFPHFWGCGLKNTFIEKHLEVTQ